MRTCTKCQEEFELKPGKPGFANVCPECTATNPPKEPPKAMGMVAWSGKHTPELTITYDAAQAHAFNSANRRASYGASLPFSPQVTPDREGQKDRDNEVIGTDYRTKMGELRRVK